MLSSSITEYGKLDFDLGPLKEAVRSISNWKLRTDPESYKTRSIKQESQGFPKEIVQQLLDVALSCFKPGYTNRVVLSCIPAGEEILPHTDDFGEEIRNTSIHCHIPLITHPSVVMGFDVGELHLKEGFLYAMDETKRHYVKNPSKVDRIHLLFAYFPHDKNIKEI